MEHSRFTAISEQDTPNSLPVIMEHMSSDEVSGFDCIECRNCPNNLCQPSGFQSSDSSATEGTEVTAFENQISEPQPIIHEERTFISISMPNSPLDDGSKNTQGLSAPCNTLVPQQKQVRFRSNELPRGCVLEEAIKIPNLPSNPGFVGLKDKRYDSFKTLSGKLEREISNLRGKAREPSQEDATGLKAGKEALPVHRYYDALEGPELETLRCFEEILLPEDMTWPFLLRYPITSFGICLGVSSQAIMWKALATSASTKFLPISLHVNLVLWCISVALVAIVATIYLLKVILFFEAVRCEYYHPVRVNFFFAPWIALLFLAIGVPPSIAEYLDGALWYVLMTPILCLELKIYGQWVSGGERRLSKVANPTNHLSIVGNFVGALLGASIGEKEGPVFFFAIGLAHYTVLFVTLYQRLPTNESLPKELHPVFFLFVATPSVASVAWSNIRGSFDLGSRIAYFISLFLYFSLAVRVNFFRGFKFSLSWWAYTFPTTSAAIATIKYSTEVRCFVTQALAVILSTVSTLTVSAMLLSTIIHAFVLRDLFPNDIAIAISHHKAKPHHHHHHHHQDQDHDHDHDHHHDHDHNHDHHHHHMKWFHHTSL